MTQEVDFLPPGYLPDLDADPPQPESLGCGRIIFLGLITSLVLLFGGWFVVGTLQPIPTEPTRRPSLTPEPPTQTLDAWSATGTALLFATASPTIDYCWWLTPTATNTPTPIFTPDAWSATGTAIYEATNPPQTATATPYAPRAWCDSEPSATFTPLSLFQTTQTPTPSATPTSTIKPLPTSTFVVAPQPQVVIPQPPTNFPTIQPIQATPTRQRKTRTPTATLTSTPTATETPTGTPTSTEIPTQAPTAIPSLALIFKDCSMTPTFIVQNVGSDQMNIPWMILYQDEIIFAGLWEHLPTLSAGVAQLPWRGPDGFYYLVIPDIGSYEVLCSLPTPTHEPEVTAEITPPTPTHEPEEGT